MNKYGIGKMTFKVTKPYFTERVCLFRVRTLISNILIISYYGALFWAIVFIIFISDMSLIITEILRVMLTDDALIYITRCNFKLTKIKLKKLYKWRYTSMPSLNYESFWFLRVKVIVKKLNKLSVMMLFNLWQFSSTWA